MTSSRNCTCQQSSVKRLDQRNISVKQDALHSCWAYDALLCMLESLQSLQAACCQGV